MLINDILSAIKQNLNSTLGTSSFKPLDKKIDDVKSSIMAGGGIKVVKSVQQGIIDELYCSNYDNNTLDSFGKFVDVKLSTSINKSKSILILNSARVDTDTGYEMYRNSAGYILDNNTIRLFANNISGSTSHINALVWQVIEFY